MDIGLFSANFGKTGQVHVFLKQYWSMFAFGHKFLANRYIVEVYVQYWT